MRKSSFMKITTAVLTALLSVAEPAFAKLSLGVRFPDLVLEQVDPGLVVNLRQLKGIPYVITNQSDATVDVQVDVEIPVIGPSQAKDGYEPVPDPTWLKVLPNKFRMGPGELASADVILSIPNDQKLVGRHFQVNIRSRTLGTGFISAAVVHYVRFSVGTLGPDSLKREKSLQTLQDLNLEMTPPAIRLENFPLGKKVDLKDMKGVLKLINKGAADVKLKMASVLVPQNLSQPDFPSTRNPEWLTVKPAKIKIKEDGIEKINLFLEIPNVPENKGKKFLFLVRGEIDGLDFPLELYSRIYVTTEP